MALISSTVLTLLVASLGNTGERWPYPQVSDGITSAEAAARAEREECFGWVFRYAKTFRRFQYLTTYAVHGGRDCEQPIADFEAAFHELGEPPCSIAAIAIANDPLLPLFILTRRDSWNEVGAERWKICGEDSLRSIGPQMYRYDRRLLRMKCGKLSLAPLDPVRDNPSRACQIPEP